MPMKNLITALLLSARRRCGPPCRRHRPLRLHAAAEHAEKKKPAAPKKKAAPAVDYVGEYVNFGDWKEVRAFLDDLAARDGFDRAELNALMAQVRFVDAAVQLVKPAPPGKPKNWQAYSKLMIDPVRIDAGVKFWNENARRSTAPNRCMACRPTSWSASSAWKPCMAATPAASACSMR
jgi:membrane-bound lytic murein transglycosylase B